MPEKRKRPAYAGGKAKKWKGWDIKTGEVSAAPVESDG